MNWDAIGAVAELLGALGVIISLLYLATQIRHNTRMAKAAGFQTLVENLHKGVDFLYDPDKVDLYLRGRDSFRDLSQTEQVIFGQMLNAIIARFATTLEYEAGNLINESYVEAHGEIVADLFRSRGVRDWWSSSNREFLNREVREWIEENTDWKPEAHG